MNSGAEQGSVRRGEFFALRFPLWRGFFSGAYHSCRQLKAGRIGEEVGDAGQRLVSLSRRGQERLCPPAPHRCGRPFRRARRHLTAFAAFSPGGHAALSGSWDVTRNLRDVSTGRVRRTFTGHSEEMWSLAFSPGGRTVLSGSEDKTIKLWDLGDIDR